MKLDNLELIAIHIKKTGEMSFKNLLKAQYGKDYFRLNIPRRESEDFPEVFRKRLSRVPQTARVVHGHFKYSDFIQISNVNPDVEIVTWLRDPVQRVISQYYYSVRKFSEGLRPNHPELAHLSLVEFANEPDRENAMSRMVEGIDLAKMKFVGFLEHFQEDLDYVTKLFGWESQPMPKKNINTQFRSNYPSPTAEEIAEITRLNQDDIELYRYGQELREKRIQENK